MKKPNIYIALSALITVSLFYLAMNDKPKEKVSYEYLDQELTNAKDYTLEVLEDMPAKDYTFKPVDDVRSFGEQAFHIAYSLEFFNARLKGEVITWEPGDEGRMNKDELVAYTTEQFEAFIEIIHSSEESGVFTAVVLSALRHNSHHRGQMVGYYRANGMEPPAYK